MDNNALRDQVKAKIAALNPVRKGADLWAAYRAGKMRSSDEMQRDFERWLKTRAGRRDTARRERRQQRKGQRVYSQQQRDARQRAFTAQNMGRAAAGEIGTAAMQANVRTALERDQALHSAKPRRARPDGVSKREQTRRDSQARKAAMETKS